MNVKFLTGLLLTAGLLAGSQGCFAADFATVHKQAGVDCASCHGQDRQALISNGNCLNCHDSFEALGELTKDMHLNPHLSPHFLNLECTSCHQGHKELNNFCQQCHGPIERH